LVVTFIILIFEVSITNKNPIMRNSNKKIQEFARETGMLTMHKGREYAGCVTVGNKEMSFEFENPDTEAYVCISPDKGRDNTYNSNELSVIRIEHPEFFQD
jgi:hypothetical protein